MLGLPRGHHGGDSCAVADVMVDRVIAAIATSLAITLYAFLGIVAGNLAYPRWPTVKSINDGRVISVAAAPAALQLSRWAPVFIVFSVILISIPYAHIWIFRLTMIGAIAFGYYERHLPPFPRSAVVVDITRRAAVLARWIQLHLASVESGIKPQPAVLIVATVAALIIAGIAYILYPEAYVLTVRTMSLVPRQSRRHSRSVFSRVSLTRRLLAVPVAAGLLSAALWLVQDIRSALPNARYQAFLSTHNQFSVTDWALVVLAAALVICTSPPRGYRRLLIALLIFSTAAELSAYVYLVRLPTWTPNTPESFWLFVITYFAVTGFGFELVTDLLDWPLRIPYFARRSEQFAAGPSGGRLRRGQQFVKHHHHRVGEHRAVPAARRALRPAGRAARGHHRAVADRARRPVHLPRQALPARGVRQHSPAREQAAHHHRRRRAAAHADAGGAVRGRVQRRDGPPSRRAGRAVRQLPAGLRADLDHVGLLGREVLPYVQS